MSRRDEEHLSVAKLKKRGWTYELIRTLLPEPDYLYNGARVIRLWSRDVVLEAEKQPLFQEKRRKAVPSKSIAPGAKHTLQLLADAWETRLDGDGSSDTWRLAEHYHHALLSLLPSAAKGRELSGTKAIAWLNEFLALEQHGSVKQTPGVLKNLLRAAGWMGQRAQHNLVRRVLDRYPVILHHVAKRAASQFAEAQPEADWHAMVRKEGFPAERLLSDGLGAVWSIWYVPQAIRTSLALLIALNPKDEYPEARALRRRFILHLGGTNTGKTYAGFQRLKQAKTGVYLAPLRLLALEAQETLLDAGVDCGLSTGEEEDLREEDTHLAATAEKLDSKRYYDVAVIDECQMIADRQRGYAWTRAILGVLSPEVHLCAAPEARDLLCRLIDSCGDSYEIEPHKRTTPLVCMTRPIEVHRIQPGDALITFSKVGVLSIAEDLRQNGKEPAIIYGALPYATRRKQMEGFLKGEMQYIVSTDAIGMGLNLPIRRIIFMETEKFDGVERRELKPEEIKQIAGRAGRFGMYNRGYVGATQNLGVVRAGLEAVTPPLEYAVAGFSELVLQADFDLLEVLTEWNKMPTVEPYQKLDITRYLTVISKMREMGFFLTKEQELRAANIPFDETEEPLRDLFFSFLRHWQRGDEIEQPGLPEGGTSLRDLELYYRKLDLYFSFAKAFNCPVDEDKLYNTRQDVADAINEILLHRLRDNIRFCDRCGKALPLYHKGRLCDACYQSSRNAAAVKKGRKR